MAERNKHTFQFPANVIAKAASAEADYSQSRFEYWQKEFDAAVDVVKATASIRVEIPKPELMLISNSTRAGLHVYADTGDGVAFRQASEAYMKIVAHREAYQRYRSDAELYATQGERVYDLDADDVFHFRLNGRERAE